MQVTKGYPNNNKPLRTVAPVTMLAKQTAVLSLFICLQRIGNVNDAGKERAVLVIFLNEISLQYRCSEGLAEQQAFVV